MKTLSDQRHERSNVSKGQGHVTCWIFFLTSGDFTAAWKIRDQKEIFYYDFYRE